MVYVGLAASAPNEAFWTPDSGMKYLEMVNLRWQGGRIAAPVADPALALDPEHKAVALHPNMAWRQDAQGNYYGSYPLLFPAASAPWARVFGLRGLLLLPAVAGVVACWLTGSIAQRVAPGRGWLATVLAGFATPTWFYSQIFWEHTLGVALDLGAVYVLLRSGSRLRGLLIAAVLLALAGWLRRELVLVALVALCWQALRFRHLWRRRIAVSSAVLGALLLAAGYVVLRARGSSFLSDLLATLRRSERDLGGFTPLNTVHRIVLATGDALYNSDLAFGAYKPDWRLAVGLAALLALLAMVLSAWARWAALTVAGAVAAAAGFDYVFNTDSARSLHGIVLGAPITLLAIGLVRRRAVPLLFATAFLSLLALDVATLQTGPATGLEWGARLLLVAYPLACVVIATGLGPSPAREKGWWRSARLQSALQVIALLPAFSAGVALQVRGISQLRSDTGYLSGWTEAFQALPPGVVVTDVWWLTMTVTPAFYRHQFLALRDGIPDQWKADDAAYIARQPGLTGLPIYYAGLEGPGGQLPAWLESSFSGIGHESISGGPGEGLGIRFAIDRLTAKPSS